MTTPHNSRYKWIALSNTTLGVLIASINTSIVLIALPDIFKGIGIDPLDPRQYRLPALDDHGFPRGHGGSGGQLRAARRHVRPGQDVQPRLRGVHRLLRAARGDLVRRCRGSLVADRAGHRRRLPDGELHGNPDPTHFPPANAAWH
jgi:hypothetical protein